MKLKKTTHEKFQIYLKIEKKKNRKTIARLLVWLPEKWLFENKSGCETLIDYFT